MHYKSRDYNQITNGQIAEQMLLIIVKNWND